MTELEKTIEALGTNFETFKETNDKRFAEIEKNGFASAETDAKLAKIEAVLKDNTELKAQIEALEAKQNRLGTGGQSEADVAKADHRKAFGRFMRQGDENGLTESAIKASLLVESDPDGGYAAPTEIDTEVSRIEGDMVAMRGLATVRQVGTADYKKLVGQGGASSGWVGETEPRPETDTPTIAALTFPAMELYSNPAATQGMLDDSFFNVEAWLADEVGIEFVEQEGGSFITGNGVAKPRGVISYPTVANASWTWGNLGYIPTGVSGGFHATLPGDNLIDLVHALKKQYRVNGTFLMNDITLATVRKFKDTDSGNYLWQPGLQAGVPDTLLGKPVETDDNMPDEAADSLSVVFADFRRGYVITDRTGVRVLRDPYTNKPYVHFYTTKRVGGGVQNFQAIKVLKFATS